MNKTVATLMFLLLAAGCKEQRNEASEVAADKTFKNKIELSIYRSGDSMLAAFRRKDWKTFVQYNHPNMTKRMGGAAAFASFVSLQFKQVPENSIKSISLGKILQVVTTPTDQQCVVEQNMKMELNGTEVDKTTYLVGESLDNGGNWTFFDASTKTAVSPKEIKPNLSNELKIPASKTVFH